MPHNIAYYRVSTKDQSIEAQRAAMGGDFDQEFKDEAVSGGTLASKRPGFSALLGAIRAGDTVSVYAVDRLGRDALDVQSTVRRLLDAGATVNVHGIGPIGRGAGEIVLAVLAQIAEMEKRRIAERTADGRELARIALSETGKTHRGKDGLGRPKALSEASVTRWRKAESASIRETASHFGISPATVKRYCANANSK